MCIISIYICFHIYYIIFLFTLFIEFTHALPGLKQEFVKPVLEVLELDPQVDGCLQLQLLIRLRLLPATKLRYQNTMPGSLLQLLTNTILYKSSRLPNSFV